MDAIRHDRSWQLRAAGGFCLIAMLPATASSSDGSFVMGVDALPQILGGVAALFGIAAFFLAWRARNLASLALQEAGEARARAKLVSGQNLSAETLVATERVWSTRLNALEAQMQNSQSRSGARVSGSNDRQMSSDLTARIDDIEKTLNGLSALMSQNRRGGPAPTPPAATPELPWPAVLKTEKQGIKELRDLLQEGSKVAPAELEILFQKLNTVDNWSPQHRPSLDEVLSFLQELSRAFHTLLRKGASQPAHEGSRMADRLLALLRPVWQKYYPSVDCRIFYPGTPFDPDWMEDQNPSGQRRPTISEMFSWAVHEKQASGRKILAKSRVTTE